MVLIAVIAAPAAVILLVWSSAKLVRQVRSKEPPRWAHIALVALSLVVLELVLSLGIAIATGLGHSVCFKRQGDVWVSLSFVVIVLCPVAGLVLFRYYRMVTGVSSESMIDRGKPRTVQVVKVLACLTAVVLSSIIVYLVGKISFWPPLMYAVRTGDASLADFLLTRGFDGTARDLCGRAPLPYAAATKRTALVKTLLQSGVDPNSEEEYGGTALTAAIANRDAELVILLLDNGARVNAPKDRPIPLMSAATGDVELVKLLLERGAEVNASSPHGTALTRAAGSNRHDVVRLLLDRGADPNIRTASGETPLMLASQAGFAEVAKSLLERAANPFLLNDQRKTALSLARQKGNAQVVEIIEAFSRTARLDYKLEAIARSIMDGNMSMLEEVVGTGVDLDASIPGYGKPCLKLAVDRERREMAEFLIQRGAGVNVPDQFSRTPLMEAAGRGDLELVKLLLDKGADPNAKDKRSRTPLSIATEQGHDRVKAALLTHGATR